MRFKQKPYWLYILAILIAVVTVYPVLWNIAGSFKGADQSRSLTLIPKMPTLDNYIQIFTTTHFLTFMVNTLIYAGFVTIVGLLFHSMAGYALARLNFPGRNLMFIAILSTMMIPFAVIMIPLFIIVRAMGMADSLNALIFPELVVPFGVFLLRQFYMGIPKELEEAGKIDGLSLYGIYWRIILPLSKPILGALAIFTFLTAWNNYLWPMIVNSSESNWVITTGIASFSQEYSSQWNLIMAGTTAGIIPTIILFVFFQKQLVEGIKMTGIK